MKFRRYYISISEIISRTLKNTKNSPRIKGETLEEHFQLVYMLRELPRNGERKSISAIKAITNLTISRIRVIIESTVYKQMKIAGWLPTIECKDRPRAHDEGSVAVLLENYSEILSALDNYDKENKKRNDEDEQQ